MFLGHVNLSKLVLGSVNLFLGHVNLFFDHVNFEKQWLKEISTVQFKEETQGIQNDVFHNFSGQNASNIGTEWTITKPAFKIALFSTQQKISKYLSIPRESSFQ